MGWLQWLRTEQWDPLQFDEDSHCLDLMLRRDFSDLRTRIVARFVHTPNLKIRLVDLISHYARELADLYALPPIRGFNGRAGQLSADAASRWVTMYGALGVDAILHEAQRGLLCQQAMYVLPMPLRNGGYKLEILAPWRVHAEAEEGDAWRAADLDAQREIRVAMPSITQGSASGASGSIVYDEVVLSPSRCYWLQSGKGLYKPSGVNPLGRIPLVAIRLLPPQVGRFHPPVHEALLDEVLSQSEQQTDAAMLVRFQAHGERVITGVASSEAIKERGVGPDKATVLLNPEGDGQPDMKIVQAQLNAQQLWGFFESQLRQFAATQGTSGDAFLHVNTAVTASAREMSLWQRQRMKAAFGPIFERAEQDLANLLRDMSIVFGVAPLEPVDVVIHYPDRGVYGDRQANAQALVIEFQNGMTTPVREIAEREGISLAAARGRVDGNLAEMRAQGVQPDPATVVASDAAPAVDTAPAPDATPASAVITEALALNGAQVVAAQGIVQSVAEGKMPRASGVQMLVAFFALKPDVADAIMGEVGKSFVIVAPVAPAAFGP